MPNLSQNCSIVAFLFSLLFVFLREHRQELFDEAFHEELASLYRKAERGQPPVAPALLVSLGDQYFLLLEVSAAAHLISEEALELKIEGGPRLLLAAGVEDVDAAYEELKAKGVTFLRPPTNQPWGLRTAYFADPEGNLWEINQPLGSKTEG